MKYKNVLDYRSNSEAEVNFQFVPYDKDNNYKDTNKSNVFTDNGSWHGYYLPINSNLSSFAGPLVLSQEVPINIGSYSNKLILKYKDKYVNFENSKFEIYSLPGKLILNYEFSDFIVSKNLIFIDGRTALIETKIINKTNKEININILIQGNIYSKVKTKSSGNIVNDSNFWFKYFDNITSEVRKIKISFNPIFNKKVSEKFQIEYNCDIKKFSVEENNNELIYNAYFGDFMISPNESMELISFESFLFGTEQSKCKFEKKNNYILENNFRWNKYIDNILKINNVPKYENLVIKALQTLVSNWRSPAGVIKQNFIIPSITYQDFIGAWSWDTWKTVVGVAQFDANLAQDFLESMFDFQITYRDTVRPNDKGMIPDCIFFNYSPSRGGTSPNWNERNSKPPIAAWAALELYKISKDIVFLKKIYPKIVAYNDWWNNNRSIKKDCILQYGATVDKQNIFSNVSSIIEAAAWESGMDNAPRFDWDRASVEKIFNKNELIGYVIDQISVDLNSFNYLDLVSLKKLATILKKSSDIQKYEDYSKKVKSFINKYMYDKETEFYYDIKLKNKKKVVDYGKGMEGILPLFSKLATKQKAVAIIENINSENFNQFVPFPSVSLDNERFAELDYWRGPVWIDQLYFGVKGVYNYGYKTFAKELGSKALQNMTGLLGDKSIRENYSTLTGAGLSTTNFSWSASLLLIIIKEIVN